MPELAELPVADHLTAEPPSPPRASLGVRLVTVLAILIPLGGVIAVPFFLWGWGFRWTDLAAACGFGQRKVPVELHGTGASFPAPLYVRWCDNYRVAHPHVRIDYKASGSGTGKTAILDETVDFGASDAAMTEEEMARVKRGVILLPLTAGNVVLAYNLEGVADLKLSRKAYTAIFLGEVTRWNDPLLVASNPGVILPDIPIQVVVRGDSSGTTFAFTTHLSAISSAFASSVGVSIKPTWPVGTPSPNGEGVADHIRQIRGAIGYLEQGVAEAGKFSMASLENKSGNYVRPTTTAAQAALASVDLFEDLIGWVPDPTPADAYPIVTFTWMICYKKYEDPRKAEALKDLLNSALDEGQQQGAALGYVPLPEKVVRRVKAVVKQIHGGSNPN